MLQVKNFAIGMVFASKSSHTYKKYIIVSIVIIVCTPFWSFVRFHFGYNKNFVKKFVFSTRKFLITNLCRIISGNLVFGSLGFFSTRKLVFSNMFRTTSHNRLFCGVGVISFSTKKTTKKTKKTNVESEEKKKITPAVPENIKQTVDDIVYDPVNSLVAHIKATKYNPLCTFYTRYLARAEDSMPMLGFSINYVAFVFFFCFFKINNDVKGLEHLNMCYAFYITTLFDSKIALSMFDINTFDSIVKFSRETSPLILQLVKGTLTFLAPDVPAKEDDTVVDTTKLTLDNKKKMDSAVINAFFFTGLCVNPSFFKVLTTTDETIKALLLRLFDVRTLALYTFLVIFLDKKYKELGPELFNKIMQDHLLFSKHLINTVEYSQFLAKHEIYNLNAEYAYRFSLCLVVRKDFFNF